MQHIIPNILTKFLFIELALRKIFKSAFSKKISDSLCTITSTLIALDSTTISAPEGIADLNYHTSTY